MTPLIQTAKIAIQKTKPVYAALTLALALLMLGGIATQASDEHGHGEEAHEEPAKGPHREGRVQLSAALAQQAGITTAVADAGKLQEQLKAHGQLEPKPELVRQLKARYPGVVRSVQVSLGDQVKAGQTLATIEANESLRSYAITAPINGVLVAQSAREGELTGEQPLFTVADYRQLSLRLPAFPQVAAKLAVSQSVSLKVGEESITSSIKAIVPAGDGSPARLALADIPNPDGKLPQGSWVEATVDLAETQVALRVDNRALQGFRDWQVLFIQVGDTYEIRPLELGRRDNQFTEVLGGLNPGDRYVVENSYLLKADLEKSGASHDH